MDSVTSSCARRERIATLATVGHELRTPITSIRGYIETLLDGGVDPPTAHRLLETAHREALRLSRLVDGMLAFSLAGTVPSDRARCDVVEQIHAVVDTIAPLAAQRHVAIATSLPASANAQVDGDACIHALVNLAENAIKYGRECGSVIISCVPEAAFVRIAVDDDGPGIASALRESIFGAGIGLAVVKAIAEYAGGAVGVEVSGLGGARFILRFPAG